MSDTATVAEKLRKPFPAEQIGKLPRGGTALDYVGHADVTSRLLEADAGWNWEPLASDEHGLPLFDTDSQGRPVGLWIKLTAGGVTRLGYGSVPSNQNDAVKVLIGDALRNAAMRFGVALDLWAKGDRADPTRENATASAGQAARRPPRQQNAGEAFQNATPAPPRNGNASRPERGKRPAAKAPDGAETDIDWMGHLVDDLIPAASTRGELLGFWDNVQEHVTLGKCADDHAKEILAMVTARAAELGFEKDKAAA